MLLCSIASNRVLNNQQIYCCNRLLPILSQKKLTDCCNPLLCLSQTTKRQIKAIKFRLVPLIIFQSSQFGQKWRSRAFNEVLNKQLMSVYLFWEAFIVVPSYSWHGTQKLSFCWCSRRPALSYSLLCSPSQTNYRTRNFLFIDEELRVTTSYALPRLDEECANCSS